MENNSTNHGLVNSSDVQELTDPQVLAQSFTVYKIGEYKLFSPF